MSQVVTKRVVLYSTSSSEHPYVISNNNEDALLKTETPSSDTQAIELDADTTQGREIVFNVHGNEEPMASSKFATTYVITNNNKDALLKTETLSSDMNKAIEFDADTTQGRETVLNVHSDEEPMASSTFATTYVITNSNEDALLKPQTLSSDMNKAIELDAATNQGREIVLNVQTDKEPMASKTFATTKTSRQVIRTYVTDKGEQKQFTIQTTPVVTSTIKVEKHGKQVQNDTNIKQQFEAELRSHHRDPNEHPASSYSQMESQRHLPMKTNQQHITPTNGQVNETNSRSTNSSKTSKPRTSIKSCYTYRVKDGVAILENVTEYQTQKQRKSERDIKSNPQETNTYTHFQQINGNDTKQSRLTQTQPLAKTLLASGVEEIKGNGQGTQVKATYPWSTIEKQIPHNKKENDKNLQGKIKFLPLQNTPQEELQLPNSPRQRQHNSEATTKQWQRHTTTYQFNHHQDTQPVKKLDASSPGRLVIPDFNQHSSTIEVKELTPPPAKVDKRKTEEWITQVATQEEVRSEPPLQANRLSADKMQFLHSQDTQPVKKLDASSPGRLVIPDFNQHSSTIEVKELTLPAAKVDKHKTEERITQVATQEEVRSEPPLQANRLSADKMQFLHSQDTQPVKRLDASSPGTFVLGNYNQRSSEVVEEEPAVKFGRRIASQWNIQSTSRYEEQPKSTMQVTTSKLVHTHEAEPVNTRNGRLPGKLVIQDFNQKNSLAGVNDATEGIPLRKGKKQDVDVWITQSNNYGEERSELPSSIGKLSGDKVKFLHTRDVQPGVMEEGSLHHGNRVTPVVNHQSFSIEVQEISPSVKDQKPKFEQWSNTTRTQVLRSEEPAAREIRSADRVQFSHSQNGQGAERLESMSPGRIVIPDSKQHSFSVEVQQYSSDLEIGRRNGQQWTTQTTTHREPPSKLTHVSGGKLQVYSTYTEPDKTLDGSTTRSLVITDVHQDSSSSQVQEVIPPPTVKKNNTEQWRTQIITHEGLESEGPETTQFLHNHQTHPINTSDSVSSVNVTVVPAYQHSFSIQTQDGKHIGEEMIKRQTTTRLKAREVQFVPSGEAQQVVTLDGSSDGTVVIPIQIEHVSSPANVQIHNG